MGITVDGQVLEIESTDKTLVEVLARSGAEIVAACYGPARREVCCRACGVEVNGRRKYACATVPEDGMQVIVDREDLNRKRAERLAEFREFQEQNCDCDSCGSSCSGSDDCCG